MPEETQPTPQPQVTTATKSHDWKKVGLTVLIILVVAGLIVAAYWFLVLNKSSDDSDLTGPVPKVTTKTATESAKEATESAEVNETEGWEIYSDSRLKFQVKYPSDWTASFDDSNSGSSEKPNYRFVTLKKGENSIKFLEGGALGVGGPFISTNDTFNIGSHKVSFNSYNFTDEQIAYMSKVNLNIPSSNEVLGFWIILVDSTMEEELPGVKKILSTFTFTK